MTNIQRTVAIIKPDVVEKGQEKAVVDAIEAEGLRVVHTTRLEAPKWFWRIFYSEHKGKPFFSELVRFMASGTCVFLLLEGDDSVSRWRQLMGATDPTQAEDGTIRARFGTGGPRNAVHGSDSESSARIEWAQLQDYLSNYFGVTPVPFHAENADG